MVYEGHQGGYARRKKRKKGSNTLFLVLMWSLVIVVGLAVAFPGTARKVRNKLGGAVGVDIEGAMEVFSREAKATNVFAAAKEAFKYAFDPSEDRGMEVLAGGYETPGNGTGEGSEGDPPPVEEGSDPEVPVSFDDLPLPDHVSLEKPRENLVLAGPMAGEVVREFGYAPDEDGDPVFHYGIDVKGESGGSVRSVAGGVVAAVGESTIFGKYVIINHGDSTESLYAMLGETPLAQGQTVEAGQAVGTVSGDTMHMELLIDGDYVNPQHYVYQNEVE